MIFDVQIFIIPRSTILFFIVKPFIITSFYNEIYMKYRRIETLVIVWNICAVLCLVKRRREQEKFWNSFSATIFSVHLKKSRFCRYELVLYFYISTFLFLFIVKKRKKKYKLFLYCTDQNKKSAGKKCKQINLALWLSNT